MFFVEISILLLYEAMFEMSILWNNNRLDEEFL